GAHPGARHAGRRAHAAQRRAVRPGRRAAARSGRGAARAAGRRRRPDAVGTAIMTEAPQGGLSTVRNAARLLKVFRSREADLGVSELARRLGLGKSTVHRMLTTLVAEGLIEQNPRTGGYRLGIVMFELGQAVRVHMDLHAAPLDALTPHTITDRSQLAAELDRVRRRGWAEAVNEREVGVASIAAPVRDISGEVVAAISIGVPLARCSVMALRRLAPVIM